MQKNAVIDLLTTLRALALATALVGLAFVLASVLAATIGRNAQMLAFLGMTSTIGMMALYAGVTAAAVLSVTRWLVARSTFQSPQRG